VSLFERTFRSRTSSTQYCWDARGGTWPLINRQSGDLIVSFSYFQNIIEEVRELKMSAAYWQHLRMRVNRLEQQWIQMRAETGAKRAPS
jgi:hypothetical protein